MNDVFAGFIGLRHVSQYHSFGNTRLTSSPSHSISSNQRSKPSIPTISPKQTYSANQRSLKNNSFNSGTENMVVGDIWWQNPPNKIYSLSVHQDKTRFLILIVRSSFVSIETTTGSILPGQQIGWGRTTGLTIILYSHTSRGEHQESTNYWIRPLTEHEVRFIRCLFTKCVRIQLWDDIDIDPHCDLKRSWKKAN